MRRITATSTLLLAMIVPATAALADDGSAPLKIKGQPSKTLQLGFELPDDWTHDLLGTSLNRGVYGRDLPAGAASCRVTVVTRGVTSSAGIERTRPRVRFRFDGGNVGFKAIERRGRWFRSGTTFDKAANSWTATGAAELDVAEDAIVVLTRGYAKSGRVQPRRDDPPDDGLRGRPVREGGSPRDRGRSLAAWGSSDGDSRGARSQERDVHVLQRESPAVVGQAEP